MSNYTFTNKVSSSPINCNVGYNNSWLEVDNNAGRDLFAQASYITNLSDINISLSSSEVKIGAVNIQDTSSGLSADVVNVGISSGALRVLTQDLESTQDDVTIGDIDGNFASVNPILSALKIVEVNPVTAVEITNPVLNVGVSNALDWDIIPAVATTGYFNPLPSFSCNLVTIFNSTSAVINIKRTGNIFSLPLYKYSSIDINVINNANEISISSSTTEELTASALATKF